ncbi:amidohydrolase family protein [Rhodobacterales bacterium HKCCE2091]|nr:amidohydrolase family protein [Rhodobacterales bacterium HKCCE2091]
MTGIRDARVIDVHAHVVLEETMGAAGEYGPEIGAADDGTPWFRIGDYRLNGVRYRGGPFIDFDARLAQMDRMGIDAQVLSPNPLTYFAHIEPAAAAVFARRHNDALAGHLAGHDRLVGLAQVPVQDITAACEELRRSVTDLGLKGAMISTDGVRRLHDPAMDPLYETFTALDVPLFIHPGPAGIDGPKGDPALDAFELDVVLGFAAQETLAVASLIFGGVLDRHPDLDICLSHGGGASAYLIGRMRRATQKRAWVPDSLRPDGALEQAYARLWMDDHLNSDRSRALLEEVHGPDRLVFGTNFAGWDAPDAAGPVDVPPAYADNARRLLRLT